MASAERRVGRVKKVDGKVNADSLQSLTLRLAGCEGESRANRELAVAESHLGPTLLVGFRDIHGMTTRWPAKSPVIISASMTLRPRRLQVRRVPLHMPCFESRFRSSMIGGLTLSERWCGGRQGGFIEFSRTRMCIVLMHGSVRHLRNRGSNTRSRLRERHRTPPR